MKLVQIYKSIDRNGSLIEAVLVAEIEVSTLPKEESALVDEYGGDFLQVVPHRSRRSRPTKLA